MMKKTLVIGASLKPERYSNMAIKSLRKHGFDVVAIGLKEGIVSDTQIQVGMPDIAGIDTVTMYINPHRQADFYEYILSLKPGRVIFNPGTENIDFINLLQKNKIQVVQNCTLVMLNSGLF